MAHERETLNEEGFGRSDVQTFTIPSGATGANVGEVNLGRNYAYIVIRCDDCQYIQSSTTLAIKAAMDEAQQMNTVYELANNTLTAVGPTLPTSGSLQFLCTPAFGSQYIHLTLSKATSGGAAVFTIYGLAESVRG